jgi:hypothetical protein
VCCGVVPVRTILKPTVLTEAASLLREHYEDTLYVPKLFPDRYAVNAVAAGAASGGAVSHSKRRAKRRKYDDDDEYVDEEEDSEYAEEDGGVIEPREPTPEEQRLVRVEVTYAAPLRSCNDCRLWYGMA